MTEKRQEWNPLFEDVLSNQIAAYDRVRSRCPIAHSEQLHWSLFRHQDVMRVLHSPNVFSNAVSGHLAVPNGFDPPEHTAYRRIIDSYFSALSAWQSSSRCAGRSPTPRTICFMVLASTFALARPWHGLNCGLS